ncbi:hypothetical protein AJ80_08697 [Polytolypa hystricis UAMH7299]|uniref:Uncharacterized protein n=1 Tax=Polytolypa hystricis (strain UAMH7299) TaxID=1447883 RepID=A0A2B7X3J8_POLH7|nr:hypothetical protein AJ80_08697 [Polytolypa hystricis UAMH7299]
MTDNPRTSTEYSMNISEEEAKLLDASGEESQSSRGKRREKPLEMRIPNDAETEQLEASGESSQKNRTPTARILKEYTDDPASSDQ